MSRASLSRELETVARQLVILTAIVESLSASLRSPQDGLKRGDDPDVGLDGARATAPGPARLGLPPCQCPPCVAERAEGKRP